MADTEDTDIPSPPTLKDIAVAAGLSVAAVSKVLNNREGVSAANRERVTRIMEDMGYRARGGRNAPGGKIESATVVIPEKYVTNDHFYGEIIQTLLKEASAEGISVALNIVSSADTIGPEVDLFRGTPPRAIVLVGIDDSTILDKVRAAHVPAVLLNGLDRQMQISSVAPDYDFGGWAATRHLLDLGHRDIVHVTHVYRETIKRRLYGFRDALQEAGIAFSYDRHVLDLGSPELLSLACRDVVHRYLEERESRPTALFCATDMVALGAIQAIQSIGLSVPDDISVIGFDGLPFGAHSIPPLTTMRSDRAEIGRVGLQLLLEQQRLGAVAVKRLSLGVELVRRDSTAACKTGRGTVEDGPSA